LSDNAPVIRGWLAFQNRYPVYVEFVGFDHYTREFPNESTRYYRVLEKTDRFAENVVLDESGEHIEKLYGSRHEAALAALTDVDYWIARNKQDLERLHAQRLSLLLEPVKS